MTTTILMTNAKPFTVSLWSSHPDDDNDDCCTDADFSSLADAHACIADLDAHFDARYFSDVPFVLLDGPGVHEVTKRPGVRTLRTLPNDAWREEGAMQAGMMGGVDAYNEAMGYD